jgi:hypothetical protein
MVQNNQLEKTRVGQAHLFIAKYKQEGHESIFYAIVWLVLSIV